MARPSRPRARRRRRAPSSPARHPGARRTHLGVVEPQRGDDRRHRRRVGGGAPGGEGDRIPVYALTNMEAETYPVRLDRFPFLRWFDGTVVSGREGVAKPDPEIFLLLLDRFGLTAGTTVMIDDREENLEAAGRLGMQTVLFRSSHNCGPTLRPLGFFLDVDHRSERMTRVPSIAYGDEGGSLQSPGQRLGPPSFQSVHRM